MLMLIPNKEASSGFNVGLPRYQWSPVLVLLFPLPASVCVCLLFRTQNTFQGHQYCTSAHLPFFSTKSQLSIGI